MAKIKNRRSVSLTRDTSAHHLRHCLSSGSLSHTVRKDLGRPAAKHCYQRLANITYQLLLANITYQLLLANITYQLLLACAFLQHLLLLFILGAL